MTSRGNGTTTSRPPVLPLEEEEEEDLDLLGTTIDHSATTEELLTDDEEELSSINERYDWEKEKQRKLMFFDDGTMSFFWSVTFCFAPPPLEIHSQSKVLTIGLIF